MRTWSRARGKEIDRLDPGLYSIFNSKRRFSGCFDPVLGLRLPPCHPLHPLAQELDVNSKYCLWATALCVGLAAQAQTPACINAATSPYNMSTASADNSLALTSALTAAAASGLSVYIPSGIYKIKGSVVLPANVQLIGAGMYATSLQETGTFADGKGLLYAESTASTLTGVRVSDLTLDGQVATLLFAEWQHLLSLNGVLNADIERVRFLGFRGDGLFLGSGYSGTLTEHNANIMINNCLFNGVNNQNRNGVTVVDGNGVTVQNCLFTNCTSATMPGAIDVEPDNAYNVIKNISILNNQFTSNGGSNGSISFFFGSNSYTPTNIIVDGNNVESSGNDLGVMFIQSGNATQAQQQAIVFSNNRVKNTVRGIHVAGINGIIISDNAIDTTSQAPLIGYSDSASGNLNVKILNNKFTRLDTVGGSGLSIFTVSDLVLANNSFLDCGAANGTFGYAINFAQGSSDAVRIIGNYIYSPLGLTKCAIQKDATHTTTAADNRCYLNTILAPGNNFQYTNQ